MRHGLLCLLSVLFLLEKDHRSEEILVETQNKTSTLWLWFQSGQVLHLADDVSHLLSVDDVGGVDHGGVAGPVHLSSLLVLSLRNRSCQSPTLQHRKTLETILLYTF